MKRLTKIGLAAGAVLLIAGIFTLKVEHGPNAVRVATWPEVSPDGALILFQRSTQTMSGRYVSDIYVMPSDGSSERRIAAGEQPMWLPDGKRILFTVRPSSGSRNAVTTLVVMNLDGTNRNETPVVGLEVWRPNVSPDSSRVVFGTYFGGKMQLMQINGSGLRELPSSDVEEWSTEPTWSHDGRLAYVSWNRWIRWVPPLVRSTALYVMNGDGTGRRLVTTIRGQAQWISWSFDNRKVAIQVHLGKGAVNICVVDVATGTVTQLTHHLDGPGVDETPAWAPDGHLYFQSVRRGRVEIYRMNADGSEQQKITRDFKRLGTS